MSALAYIFELYQEKISMKVTFRHLFVTYLTCHPNQQIWGLNCSDCEECRRLECDAVWFLLDRLFGGTYRFRHQGGKMNELWTTLELLVVVDIVPSLMIFFSPWWCRRYVPQKLRLLQETHSVTSQKTAFFNIFYMFLISILGSLGNHLRLLTTVSF
jgi:hypothetical protein